MKPCFIIATFLLTACSLFAFAQETTTFPTPTGNPKQLFFLQRNQNTNTVVYELNTKNDVLDTVAPVHIFWIDYAEKSQKEDLTAIQKKYAYGITSKRLAKDNYELLCVADKTMAMELAKDADEQFHVFTAINGKRAILSRVYLEIHGGSPFSPHVDYIELSGIDPETHAEVSEKRMPPKK